jgi:signal peptidase I
MKKGLYKEDKKLGKHVTERWLQNFEKDGKGWLIITTNSMSPFIRAGDIVIIEKVSSSTINIGDIITFWRDERLIVHRIIRKVKKEQKLFFVERADRHPSHSLISSQDILGKAMKIKKGNHTYSIDTLPWHLLNRFVGMTLYCSVNIRRIKKNFSFFPDSLKKFIRKTHRALKQFLNKVLEVVLTFNKEK